MSHRWRACIALILLLVLPLRVIAAGAMPCCAATMDTPEASTPTSMEASMDMAADADAGDPDDGCATMTSHHDGSHPTFDCCMIVMIARPIDPIAVPRWVPPQAMSPRPPAVAHFVTDAPERPPRAATPMV